MLDQIPSVEAATEFFLQKSGIILDQADTSSRNRLRARNQGFSGQNPKVHPYLLFLGFQNCHLLLVFIVI